MVNLKPNSFDEKVNRGLEEGELKMPFDSCI